MISTSEQSKLANTVALLNADDAALERVSREGLLSLSLNEMKTIQAHYQTMGRNPTDIELETIAQTWSEHCYHKTFRASFDYREEKRDGEPSLFNGQPKRLGNLIKETIFRATRELNMPWCLSVFEDNAGVIAFDDTDAICFKVETHNHPSALEPYGGAGTGLGGVIRDILGCGLGGKPVMNTDVFCFGMMDTKPEVLREGMLHPKRIARGVVSGVRDYGNRMGIPTANGAIYFDPGYTGNPLVFCGTVGLIPNSAIKKTVLPGDLVVTVGGRTGRDGIHGATFSSAPLEKGITSSVVQIGHAIVEKKAMDVLLQARDKRLYRSVTDCGAGGFSSSIGELGKDTGVRVDLEKAPLKYPGLKPWEIWLSESQERMILAVPLENWPALKMLFDQEDVEAVVIGEFTNDRQLTVQYDGTAVAELDMAFMHEGCPKLSLEAVWNSDKHAARYRNAAEFGSGGSPEKNGRWDNLTHSVFTSPKFLKEALVGLLSHPVIGSKERVIRQYDHEVQGGSIIKPLMGLDHDAPMDACVFRPKLNAWKGVVVSNGLAPEMGKWDPYLMAQIAVDEAYRNMIAVGGQLTSAAILDNFCWGDSNNPHDAGALVRAAEGAREAAEAYQLPFISGKDSFHNTWRSADGALHSIPPTLLISAIGVLDDVRGCVTSDLKHVDHLIYLVGDTQPTMKGSLAGAVLNIVKNSDLLPVLSFHNARMMYKKLQTAMKHALVASCHDVSDGGLLVALAEMAFGGAVGLEINTGMSPLPIEQFFFSESPSRFVVAVAPEHKAAFETALGLGHLTPLGKTTKKRNLTIKKEEDVLLDVSIAELKKSWLGALEAF
jgi:phosphoribosylformylglycinamidine synthase